MLKYISLGALLLLLLGTQTSERIHVEGYQFIRDLSRSNRQYLGTMVGRQVATGVFDKVLIVKRINNRLDTLFQADKNSVRNDRGQLTKVAGGEYSGYAVDSISTDSFGMFLIRLPHGPSSDEMTIIWNDSLHTFRVQDDEP
jgi:hypothetical protein